MSKFLTNIYPIINIHKKMSVKSEITTQMIYGESFSIIKKGKNGLKLKLKKMDIVVISKIETIVII